MSDAPMTEAVEAGQLSEPSSNRLGLSVNLQSNACTLRHPLPVICASTTLAQQLFAMINIRVDDRWRNVCVLSNGFLMLSNYAH